MPRRPPRLARLLLTLALPPGVRGDTVLGDLDEEFQIRARESSAWRAAAWYWRAALSVSLFTGHDRWQRRAAHPPPVREASMIDRVLQDLRPSVRLLTRHRAFALAAIVTLALGIGANTAVFTVAWHLLLKPLPYPHGDRLVEIWENYAPPGGINPVMPANYRAWARDAQAFEAIAAFTYFTSPVDLTGTGEPEQLKVRYVTSGYFAVFETPALAGRVLDARDAKDDARSVVVSEGLWQRRFAGSRDAIGRTIRLGGDAHEIVGVMPASFGTSAGAVDVWASYVLPPETGPRLAAHYLGAVARIKAGTSLERAREEVKQIADRDAKLFPETNKGLSATVRSMNEARGGPARAGMTLLAAAAALVLLIACANLASLHLARGLARAREFSLRSALGASRGRLILQQTIEGLVLACTGTATGLALSMAMLRLLARVAPADIAEATTGGLDGAVLGVALAMTGLVAVLSATAPAWRAATRATTWMRDRTQTGDRITSRLRTLLVTGQVALAVMLLVAAMFLISSLAKVLNVRPGFDPTGVLAFDMSLPAGRYGTFAAREQLLNRVSEALRALPGVQATCVINEAPFDGGAGMTYVPEGQTKPIGALPRNITPGCFEVLRVPLVLGRSFRTPEAGRVGIVSERFARAAWPGADPLGKRVHLGVAGGALITIVGVVADSRQVSLEIGGGPQFYEVASEAAAFWGSKMLVRTAVPPNTLLTAVRATVRRVDADQPVARLRTLEDTVGRSLSARRFNLLLIVAFVTIAMTLAAVGVYGVLNHLVVQRQNEIVIRMALGATAAAISRLMMTHAWVIVAAGVSTGLVGAWLGSGLLRTLVFGILPTAWWVYAAAAITLAIVALVAAWLPARRAARLDPLGVLRQ